MSTRMVVSVTIKQRLLMGYIRELMWSMGGSLMNRVYYSFTSSLSSKFRWILEIEYMRLGSKFTCRYKY